MKKIAFVCHGNICRSPMAEFIFNDLINTKNLSEKFKCESFATSTEALGFSVDRRTVKTVQKNGIKTYNRNSQQLKSSDYDLFDYFIIMDSLNEVNIKKIFKTDKKNKIFKARYFNDQNKSYDINRRLIADDVSDPWYYDNFDEVFMQLSECCNNLVKYIANE